MDVILAAVAVPGKDIVCRYIFMQASALDLPGLGRPLAASILMG